MIDFWALVSHIAGWWGFVAGSCGFALALGTVFRLNRGDGEVAQALREQVEAQLRERWADATHALEKRLAAVEFDAGIVAHDELLEDDPDTRH